MVSSHVPRYLLAVALAFAMSVTAQAQTAETPVPGPTEKEVYDELLARYLSAAREQAEIADAGPSWSWMNSLALDSRARDVNDLITVRVIESISGVGTADSSLAKESSGSASLLSFFGLDSKLPSFIDPTSLINSRSGSDFQGGGATTRVGELTANLTARVSEVLPNGDLVVEGVREMAINGDRQILVLTGVVRPEDIDPSNVVESTAIGQLRIQYFGQGLIRDNLQPGFLVRLLNWIF